MAGKAKSSIGIPQECESIKVAMCNPILQARLLNKEQTDLNVIISLCVGHDSLFYKYSEVYATTCVTKDHVTDNTHAAALYTTESYYLSKEVRYRAVPHARYQRKSKTKHRAHNGVSLESVIRKGEPGHHQRHQPGQPGLAVDRDDGSKAGEMGVQPLEGTGHPLSLRNHRGGVRLLCGDSGTRTDVVAGA